jgi:tetratricopeptide (TPR) repeat protein
VIYAGGVRPLNAFYLGLYGGSELPGVLAGDTSFHMACQQRGYREIDRVHIIQLDLACFRAPITRNQRQLRRDPSYALAYAGIAYTYSHLGHELYCLMHPRDTYPKAKAAALKALTLDATLAEAHAVLGSLYFRYDWDWAAAEREHKRAIELNPRDGMVHIWYSHYLLPMGRLEESLAESKRALELEPLSLIINVHLGWHYLYAREHDQAIRQLKATLEMAPDFPVASFFLGQAYEQKGLFDEAISEFQKGVRLSRRNPVHLAALAHGYALSGRRAEAEKLLDEVKEASKQRYVPSYEIAVIYAGLDQKKEALTWLEQAHEQRDSSWLVDVGLDPRFQRLHSEPRFRALLKKLGLPN